MARKALGRGIGAIIPDLPLVFDKKTKMMVEIELEKISALERIFDREFFSEVKGDVVVLHVVDDRVEIALAVADARPAGLPGPVRKVDVRPRVERIARRNPPAKGANSPGFFWEPTERQLTGIWRGARPPRVSSPEGPMDPMPRTLADARPRRRDHRR